MSSGFLYHLFRPFAKVSIGIYFRKLYFTGRAHIPSKGPIIIACNHPNSFAEPVLMASFQSRTLHFLVRGDIFENPLVAWALKQTNQIPIYRKRDGYQGLKKNEATFEAVYEKLSQKEAIMIFSEGLCIMEKRLRPIQKGTARMALGAIERHPALKDLKIIPAGVTYSRGYAFRSEIIFNIGEPISVWSFFDDYQNHPAEAVNNLTTCIEEAIKSKIIHIDNSKWDALYDDLMDIIESEQSGSFWPINEPGLNRFNRERRIAEFLNTKSNDEILEIQELVSTLKKSSKKSIKNLEDLKSTKPPNKKVYIWLLFGWILMLLGVVINIIPFLVSVWIGSYFKKTIEFYTPVRMAVLMFMALIQNSVLIIFSIVNSYWWLGGWAATAPLTGWAALIYLESAHYVIAHYNLKASKSIDELVKLRKQIISRIYKEH